MEEWNGKWNEECLNYLFFIPTHSQSLFSFLNFSIHTLFHFFYSLMLKGGTRSVTGWVLLTGFYDDFAPMGLLWFYPERIQGVRYLCISDSRLGFARRAVVEPRSCYNNTAPEGRHHNSSIGAKCFLPRAKPRGAVLCISDSRLGFARRAVCAGECSPSWVKVGIFWFRPDVADGLNRIQ
jgi:hypothetical protein